MSDYDNPFDKKMPNQPTIGVMGVLSSSYENPQVFPIEPIKGIKFDAGKADLSLIPLIAQTEEAKAFMVGEKKYGRYNYCKGLKASQLIGAAERHIKKWFNGEEYDQEDGQHHLGAARACLAMALRQMELGTMEDDRYKGPSNASNK